MVVFKPCVRGSFSDRNELSKINTTIQKESLDERTRNGIINIFDSIMKQCDISYKENECYKFIFKEIFLVTSDDIPEAYSGKRNIIAKGIKKEWEYHEIFSFLEELLKWYSENIWDFEIYDRFNKLFEREFVGYRFIEGIITDIIDQEEIKEIETAMNNKYSACKRSISKAVNLLYDREKPDYSNSVKESISAIEAMCNIILGTSNSTLGAALNNLEKKGVKIHGAMKNGFSSLYGYTSDKSGIRHNDGIDENTTFEEAKYMLVSCSAFLNYLIQIYEGIK